MLSLPATSRHDARSPALTSSSVISHSERFLRPHHEHTNGVSWFLLCSLEADMYLCAWRKLKVGGRRKHRPFERKALLYITQRPCNPPLD